MKRQARSCLLAVLATVLVAAVAAPASARPFGTPTGEVKALVEQAEANVRAKKYLAAVDAYRKANEISGDPAYLFNISVLYLARLRDPVMAWEFGSKYAESVRTDEERKDAADWLVKVEEALAQEHGRITIRGAPPDARIWLDRRDDSYRLVRNVVWAVPGNHWVLAEVEGAEPVRIPIQVQPGVQVEVPLDLKTPLALIQAECPLKDCSMRVDGATVRGEPAFKRVSAGRHLVRFEAPGVGAIDQRVDLAEGETRVVRLDLRALLPGTAPPTPTPAPVAVAPKPEPKPEPVVVAPKPEPKPEPVVVAPKPEPRPEPVAVAPKPEPRPEPVVVAPKPEPTPEPGPAVPFREPEPLAATPQDTMSVVATVGPTHPYRTWGWVSMGTGVALAAAGTALYFLGRQDLLDAGGIDCNSFPDDAACKARFESKRDGGRTKAYAGYGLMGAGGAALATGLVLYFLPGRDQGVTVEPGPGTAGLTARVRW